MMKKYQSVYSFNLDNPGGSFLADNIRSSITIRAEINDNNGVDLRILLDHSEILSAFSRFLKEVIASDPVLTSRQVNAINICAPEFLTEPITAYNRFTLKENEILGWVAEGESNKEIASHMHIETETVRTHLKKASVRMNLKNRIRGIEKYRNIKGEIFMPDADLSMLVGKIATAAARE